MDDRTLGTAPPNFEALPWRILQDLASNSPRRHVLLNSAARCHCAYGP